MINLNYTGKFSIELIGKCIKRIRIPRSVTARENTLYFKDKRLEEVSGKMRIYLDENDCYYFNNKMIKTIRDGDGNILWENK